MKTLTLREIIERAKALAPETYLDLEVCAFCECMSLGDVTSMHLNGKEALQLNLDGALDLIEQNKNNQ